jgi:hypothetical protein
MSAAASVEQVLACIRQHQVRLDFEVSAQIGVPLETVRRLGAELIARGAVISCAVTRYEDGEPREAWLYRIAGYVPPPAPGRKARVGA